MGNESELADPNPQSPAPSEELNKSVVLALYDALNTRDVSTVHRLLAPDLEWWFHGPPHFQFMMRLLTGLSPNEPFLFKPQKIAAFGPTVLAEGSDSVRNINWVHAWTVVCGTDGLMITQVREYFNTSVTVTRVAPPSSSSSSLHCLPQQLLWESTPSEESVPGLVLAI
ncbi:Wound-induced protein 1 [Acorus calamus]|uniref:Wound-induced protein 1 n=1 Tax=Acorus calamus TaxID=4465 RepID=A0AAV9F8E2_ACOCL|nr:Wound-induced protein 1 [Acorus calamus]